MHTIARVLLGFAAILIAAGGLFDIFTPKLPINLAAACAGNETAMKLVRELLRALGGALAAIGAAVLAIVLTSANSFRPRDLILILLLVVPAEGVNAICMRRVRSPWQIPAAFIALTLVGWVIAFASK